MTRVLLVLGSAAFGLGWYLLRQARNSLSAQQREMVNSVPNPHAEGVRRVLRTFVITAAAVLLYSVSTRQWLYAQFVAGAAVLGTLVGMPFLVRGRVAALERAGIAPGYGRRLLAAWYLTMSGLLLIATAALRR